MLHLLALSSLFLALVATPRIESESSNAESHPVILLELFTSQGCESCPAADHLLKQLPADSSFGPFVIPLAYHVDFWDNLGWKDPFSKSQFSERQLAYQEALGMANFYTPQMIVNGRTEVIGSWEKRVRQAIEWEMGGTPKANCSVRIIDRRGTEVEIVVDAVVTREISGKVPLNLMLAVFENNLQTDVTKGENKGKTLQNDFVARRLDSVATVSGVGGSRAQSNIRVPLDETWETKNLGFVLFVQDPLTLAIHGAAATRAH